MQKVAPHLLPMLALIVKDKGRPVEYAGHGRDTSVPSSTARELSSGGWIEKQGANWIATKAGRNAVGWA